MPRITQYTQCRLCKTLLRQAGGCSVCGPAKKNFETPNEDERISTGRQTLRLLQDQLDRLEYTQKDAGHRMHDHTMSKAAVDLAKGISTLLRELRFQEEREVEAFNKLNHAELVEAMGTMTEAMPSAERQRLLETLLQQEEAEHAPPPDVLVDDRN